MLNMTNLVGFGSGSASYQPGNITLVQAITNMGAATNLQLALDAGDSASFTSGQKWLDTSGNGQDFFLGTSASSEGTDPTFNGSSGGKSSGEYFSTDGGDRFTYDTTNETWMNNIHKDNAAITLALAWYNNGAGTNQQLMGTANNSSEIGFRLLAVSTNEVSFAVANGAGNQVNFASGANTIPSTARWNTLILSFDEAAGGSASFCAINGTIYTFNGTNASPSASNATNTFCMMQRPFDTTVPVASGGRFGQVAAWSRAITQGEALDLHGYMANRYGI